MRNIFSKSTKKTTFNIESLLGGLPQPLFVADKDLNIIYFNDAVAKLTGYSKKEALGKKCHDILKANICSGGCAIKYCMKENKTINDAEVQITLRNGETIPILANAAPVMDDSGTIIGGMETMQDIRHEKEAAEKMAADSSRATARIYDAIFTRDKDENITYFNDEAERLTGYKREEVLGKKCRDIFKANICEDGCAVKACMNTGNPILGAEVMIKNRHQKDVPVMARADVIRDVNGEIVGGMEIIREISQEKELLENIKNVANKLMQSSEEISANTDQITMATTQIATSIGQVAQGASEQSNAASKAATAVDEVSSAISNVVESADDQTQSIAELTSGINEIIEVIDDISSQTNLLALNAAIEAARAGEHGKGFAVVADEVGKLAERSATATSEIGDLIHEIQDKIGGITESNASKTREVAKSTNEVVSAVDAIAAASEQAAASAEEVSASAEEQSATIEQIAASIEELSGAANQLNELLQTYKIA